MEYKNKNNSKYSKEIYNNYYERLKFECFLSLTIGL